MMGETDMTASSVPPGPGVRPAGDTPTRFRALPLRLLVAGRFGLAPGRLHRLDSGGVEALLDRTRPRLALRVQDLLRADGTALTVELAFGHRRDFEPGAVARAVPELARLLDAPTGADRASAGPAAPMRPAAAPGALPAAGGAPADGPGDDALDRLLGMVDVPGTPAGPSAPEPADPARAAVSGFIAGITRRPAGKPAAGAPDETVEGRLAAQIAAIVGHPEFQALERGWGALRFLVRRVERGNALAIDVVEAGDDGLAELLEPLVPEDDPDPAGPVRIVVDLGDHDASDRDVGRLRRLAAFGASRRAVILANAGIGFAGDGGPEALAAMHDPETLFEDARYAAWRTLRDDGDAGWLGLCLTRLALRDAGDGQRDKGLRLARPARIGRPLDVGAAPAVAALFAGAAAATDWPCAVGTTVQPVVDNLVLVEGRADGFDGPIRPAPSARAADSLASAGLIALVAERGRDTARLLRVPSVRRPPGRQDSAEVSLITRLFQAQVVHGLQWNADRLFNGDDHATTRRRVEAYLAALVSSTGPGAAAEVRIDRDDDDTPVLAIHVRSGSAAAPGAAMAFDIPLAPPAPQPAAGG